MKQQPSHSSLQLRFNSGGSCPVRECLLTLAAVQCRANLPDQSRSPGEREVDLQRNRQARVRPQRFGCGRIALGHGLIHNQRQKLAAPQRSQGSLSSLCHFNVHAQLRTHYRGAILCPFNPVTIRMLISFLPIS